MRAVTRKPDSEAGRALAQAGAEVVAADMDDAASVQRAMSGAYGAYCVTNFWEHFSPEKELAQAAAMADGAAGAGVQHVIWSTLEDTRTFFAPDGKRMPVLMGKYNVPHFDAKGEADALFTSKVPTTLLYTSFYWDNLIHFGMGPKKGPDGVLAFTLPMADKRMSGIAAEDIGKCAFGIFREGAAHVGRSVGIAGEHLTGAQMAAELTKALGQPVRYNAVTPGAVPRIRFSRRRGPRQHVPVLRRVRGGIHARASARCRAPPESGPADLRGLPRAQQEPDTSGLTGGRCGARRGGPLPEIAILRPR